MFEELYFFNEEMQGNNPIIFSMAGISYCDGSYNIARSSSDVGVLEYIIDGYGTLMTNDTIYHPKKGDVYLLPQNTNHFYYSSAEQPWTKIWVNFKKNDLLFQHNVAGTIYFPDIDIEDTMRKLVELSKNPTPETIKESVNLMNGIFKYLNESTLEKNDDKSEIATDIRQYINDNIYENITLADITEHFNISSQKCIRIFKKAYSSTPYAYILNQKLNIASNLLTTTNLTVRDISEKLSFSDEFYFSNIFKKKYNSSPSEYRKNQKSKLNTGK